MSKRRKTLTYLVTVSAPARIETWSPDKPYRTPTAREIAREVRSLIEDQSMHTMNEGDIKVRAIRLHPAK